MLRLRYGVQVNSLGLTEAQPENNVQRIVLEALAVTMGRGARARAIQLPAWNEALGLPRPWDQQWSLRIQQVLAFETDLLEYPDIFEGSKVMDGLVDELVEGAKAEMKIVEEHGGAVEAVPYMKGELVASHRERVRRIEAGELKVIGQNSYTETEDSPLTVGEDGGILTPDPEVERERDRGARRVEGRARRGRGRCGARRSWPRPPRRVAEPDAGDDRGGQGRRDHRRVVRDPARGLRRLPRPDRRRRRRVPSADDELLAEIRAKVDEASERIGKRIKILVAKPGLDGHSNGAEQIAVRARDAGMEVVYQGIRLTPEEIATSALQEDVDVVGLSILSGSHMELIPEIVRLLRDEGVDVPVVVGGIIPPAHAERLRAEGVARVYTPKDFDLNRIMGEIAELVGERAAAAQPA